MLAFLRFSIPFTAFCLVVLIFAMATRYSSEQSPPNLLAQNEQNVPSLEQKNLLENQESRKNSFLQQAATESSNGLLIEACQTYASYLIEFPEESAGRREYASSLMTLQRFDLALEQYKWLANRGLIEEVDYVNFLSCLFHQNDFAAIEERSLSWFKDPNSLSTSTKIAIANVLRASQHTNLSKEFIDSITNTTSLSLDEKLLFFRYWVDGGDYYKTEKLLPSILEASELSLNRHLLLSYFYGRLNEFDQAAAHIKKAYELDPLNPTVIDLAERYLNSSEEIEQRTNLFLSKLQLYPESPTLTLNLIRSLINAALQIKKEKPKTLLKQISEFRQAQIAFEKIHKNAEISPSLFFLLGESSYLDQQSQEASTYFEKCISLDPSHSHSLRFLGFLSFEKNEKIAALNNFKLAVHYDPYDPETWQDLASAYTINGDLVDASESLEQAIKMTPRNAILYTQLAELKLKLQNPEAAMNTLELALMFSPNNLYILKLLLKTLQDTSLERSSLHSSELEKRKGEIIKKIEDLEEQKRVNQTENLE